MYGKRRSTGVEVEKERGGTTVVKEWVVVPKEGLCVGVARHPFST